MSISRTILKNTMSNWAGMIITLIVTILIIPFMLKHLGNERYGIYQIVFPVIHYMVLLEFGMRGSVVRFASKYISSQNIKYLNSVISTVFFFCLGISAVIMLLSFVVGISCTRFFDISEEYKQQTIFLVLALGFNTIISFLSYSFCGVIIGHNRYELQNVGMLIQNVGRALLVVTLFTLGWVSLSSWALAIAVTSLLGLLFFVWMAYYLQKGLSIRWQSVNKKTVKELFGFGIWNMVLQLSNLMLLSVNPVIIGKFLGASQVPYYAIPFMLIIRLQTLVVGLTTTLKPHASSTLCSGDKSLLNKLAIRGTYISSMLVFPLGGVLLVMCKNLFHVWLPAGFENSWVIYAVLMIAFFGSIPQTASISVLIGGGNIQGLSLAHFFAAIAAAILGVIFVGYLNMGLLGAALALVICRFFTTSIFQPWYVCRQINTNVFRYISESYTRPVLCSLPSVALGALLVYYLPPSNLFGWVIEYFVALIPFAVFALTGVLAWPLRENILAKLASILNIRKNTFN